jgi:hypothetical protein
MPTTTKSATQAAEFLAAAKTYGFTVTAKNMGTDAIVTIEARFEPGDAVAYCRFDSDHYRVLSLAPVVTYGSTWGTDSASVGGHAGLTGGYYRMNKSGVSKRFANAIIKAQNIA